MKKGFFHSKESREKMRLSHIGKKRLDMIGNKIMLGRVHSKKTKNKMRNSHLGEKNHWYGKHHTEESKRKISNFFKGKPRFNRRGDKNFFWKGGVTNKNLSIRMSLEYKLWRTAVFERDNYTCIWCGLKGGNGVKVILNADHIKPFCDYPELRFAIDNGRTLCIDCHKKTDTYGINQYSKGIA